ncbi:MAG: ABC transporter ATP-binding protein [Patescibacteria group bacterium]
MDVQHKVVHSYAKQGLLSGASEESIIQSLLSAQYEYADILHALDTANTEITSQQSLEGTDSYKHWLRGYYLKSKWSILKLILLDMIIIGLTLLEPWPLKILADSVFNTIPAPGFLEPYTGTYTLLVIVALASVGLFITTSIAAYIDERIVTKLKYKLDVQIKSEMFNHIIRLPFYHKERLHKGDYINRLNSLTGDVGSLVLNSTSAVIESVFTIIGVLVVLLFINFKLTLVGITVIPFLYFSIKFFAPRIQKITELLQNVYGQIANHVQESVENAETIQSLTNESSRVATLKELMAKRLRVDLRSLFVSRSFGFTNSLLVTLGTTSIMLIGGRSILNGAMSFGELFIFINYMQRLYNPIERLTGSVANIKKRRVSAKRVFDVINDHEEVERTDEGFPMHDVRGQITFKDVSISYDDQDVLRSINLTIPAGSKVGFIGPSGGGKSTLLKTVSRFIPPTSGSIYIDEYDISQASLDSLRNHITIVTQQPQLFSGTILDNLVIGARSIPNKQQIAAALDAANATEFVVRLPGKVDAHIGESGSSLSGGQKQRIAIARSYLRPSPVMILDEPTSALDSTSAKFVRDNLRGIVKDSTVLMITHKSSMLKAMDRVYVVQDGTVRDVNEFGGIDAYLNFLNSQD